MRSIGTIRVDEELCDIVNVRFADGLMYLQACSRLPRTQPSRMVEDFIVYGTDGTVILTAKVVVKIPRRSDGYLNVELPVALEVTR